MNKSNTTLEVLPNLTKSRDRVILCHNRIEAFKLKALAVGKPALEAAIEAGELLSGVKATLPHGQWLPWIEANLPFSQQTASRYTRCYERREEIKLLTLSNLADAYRLLEDAEGKKIAHVSHNSGQNEWYTPSEYVEAGRAAMGSIDCDPASSKLANKTVKAEKFYTLDDDGLSKPWSGNVWMNPPYGQPFITNFSEALCRKFSEGEITSACVLVNNATETVWFQNMLSRASAACFLKGRIKFNDTSGEPAKTPLQGQVVLFFGTKVAQFSRAFASLGITFLSSK